MKVAVELRFKKQLNVFFFSRLGRARRTQTRRTSLVTSGQEGEEETGRKKRKETIGDGDDSERKRFKRTSGRFVDSDADNICKSDGQQQFVEEIEKVEEIEEIR